MTTIARQRITQTRKHPQLIVAGLLLILTFGSCTSRYKASLYSVSEKGRASIKPSEMFYVEGMSVFSPLAEAFMMPARGHLAAMAYYVKDTGIIGGEDKGILQYRRRTDYRMFLPLPEKLAPGPVTLDNSAFVRDFSSVEVSLAERTFLFAGGSFSVDSIKSSDLYTSLNAVFRSLKGDSLKYEGRMKFMLRERFYFRGAIYRRSE